MSETERLIEYVKERRFLFDLNDPDYKNRPKRLGAWKEIARDMGAGTAEIWNSKWKGLKDNYAKFKKTFDPAYAQTYKKYKNWPWSEHMRFLDDCNSTTSRRICSSLTKPKAKQDIQDTKLLCNVLLYTPDSNITNQVQEPAVEDVSELQTDVLEYASDSKKRKLHNRTELPEEILELLKIKMNEDKPALDGVDHFFLSYAQSFKKLPNRMQIMLKLEIATLFSRYELQAEGVTTESVDNIPRIVPCTVKSEFDLANTVED